MAGTRQGLALTHRWIGLAIAGFLAIAGLTGMLLPWVDALDAALYPPLTVTEPAGVARVDPLIIREQLQARYPQVVFDSVDLRRRDGTALVFNPRVTHVVAANLGFDQVLVNPHTGHVQGVRMWGDPAQGLKNLIPFLYRLH